ncbi:MAG: 50S ribosomal protein L6, partial [Spirochaetaceae bacterium]|nr:50S ribosomal protein L6 [Spirochaetaceae bacterium]
MSKVGKLPVAIPAGVTVNVADGVISVKGPKGELKQSFHNEIDIKVQGSEVVLTTKDNAKQTNAYHGLYRSLINNMVKGVTEGFTKTLIVNGVGFRAEVKG